MSNFKIIVIGIFIVFIIAGVLVFASLGNSNGSGSGATVVIWGTLPQADMDATIKKFTINATYVYQDPSTFESSFVNALAQGTGPDVILLPQDLILKEEAKVAIIPYSSYSQRTFMDTFVQEGELFLGKNGVIGLPFTIDPLVMYWNRDLYTGAAIATPPVHWNDLYTDVPKLTIKNSDSTISQSAVALGDYSNVDHAKDILATLILQTGDSIVTLDPSVGTYKSTLGDKASDQATSPAEAALNFYTGFADPSVSQYSWNQSLPSSQSAFLGGSLATYFGYASELADMRAKNPNLNFDVASIPQASDTSVSATFANMDAVAILKNSKNQTGALSVIQQLTGSDVIAYLTTLTDLPPVRRDLLAVPPQDPALAVFYTAAIQGQGWLDPDVDSTAPLFQNMIESVVSGQLKASEAINSASIQLGSLLQPINHDILAQ